MRYRDDIDAAKASDRRKQLLHSLQAASFDDHYEIANPEDWNKLSFRPNAAGADYRSWPLLNEFPAIAPINGLMEKRSGALIDIDKASLEARMQAYFNPKIDWATLKLTGHPLLQAASGYKPEKARSRAISIEAYDQARIVRYLIRPFDVRHAYVSHASTVWNRSRPDLWAQYSGSTKFIMTRAAGTAKPEGAPINYTACLTDDHAMKTDAFLIAFENHTPASGMLPGTKTANLSARARAYLVHLGLPNPDTDTDTQTAIWHHALAIGYAPKYLSDNRDGLSIDWPRIPLPDDRQLLANSAALGAQIAALLDTEADAVGVTSGSVAEHLKVMGIVSENNLRVAAGWGSKDSKNRINPGRGKIALRDWTDSEKAAMAPGFAALGMTDAEGLAFLGRAVNVYLNATTFWQCVPEAVWNYYIGGYQVIKKWLSYREEELLGRHLTKDEAREVTNMTRRIAALILLGKKLDANYAAVASNVYAW